AWRAAGSVSSSVTYSYRDSSYQDGPCSVAIVAQGKLKAVCRARVKPIPYSLDEPEQRRIGVNFSSGARALCAVFGGRIAADSGTSQPNSGGRGRFVALSAPQPDSCPIAPGTCP